MYLYKSVLMFNDKNRKTNSQMINHLKDIGFAYSILNEQTSKATNQNCI